MDRLELRVVYCFRAGSINRSKAHLLALCESPGNFIVL
jgi:hypothetical protein